MNTHALARGTRSLTSGWAAALFALPCKVLLAAFVAVTLCGCPDEDDGGVYVPPPIEDYDTNPNDQDFDEVADDLDNCRFNYNRDQTDDDGDGHGNACDNCTDAPNEDQADLDGDGAGDLCDECVTDIRKTEEGVCGCGTPDVDLDGDGQPDCDGTPFFMERVIDDTISQGAQVELADLDGDGDLDVVAAIANTDTIFAYLNEANGENWIRVTVAPLLSFVATSIALADIDGDGDLDVAAIEPFDRFVGEQSPGQVMWYRQPPGTQGEWEANEVTGQTFSGARYITTGDLTGNGRPDLVIGGAGVEDANRRRQGDGVYWIPNTDGGQTWGDPITIDGALEGVYKVLTHDVDDDGVTDVLASGFEDNDVMWYANSRSAGVTDLNPTFTPYSLGLIPEPYDIAIVEDGFGYTTGMAVIVTDTGAQDNLDVSYLVPLTVRTESWVSWTVASDFPDGLASRVCPVDFNGDGINDVAVTSQPWSDLRVYLGMEGGQWDWLSVAGGAYTGLTDVKCGDIDGDGRPDLVTITTGYFRGDRVAWWPNP